MITTAEKRRRGIAHVWLVLALPPLLFFAVIVLAAVIAGIAAGGDAGAAPEMVTAATPYILLVVQILMLGLVSWAIRAERLGLRNVGWHVGKGQHIWREVILGSAIGVPLGFAYIFIFSPLLSTLQRGVGDYVPPDQTLAGLGSALLPFFIANVLLAPFVEETLYRGYAISELSKRYRLPMAILLSCVFFGLLHWAGGFWYILLTGLIAGGLLATLYVWRQNIVAAFAAHLTLNLVEFLLVWLVL